MGESKDSELLNYLEAQKRTQLDAAREIAERAKGEARGLTPEESEAASGHMTSAQDFDKRITGIQDAMAVESAVEEMGRMMSSEPAATHDPSKARTMGDAFIASSGFQALIEAASRGTGQLGRFTTQSIEVARTTLGATAGTILESTGTNDDGIPINYLPGLYTPGLRQGPLTLADLFAQGQTTQPVINYQTATTRTPPTDHGVTNEGAPKKLADFAFDKEQVTLTKLTAFIKISEEMVADSSAVRDYVNAQLPMMVRQDEEFKLATDIYAIAGGAGGGGFALDSDIGGSNGFDAIAAGINVVQNFGFFNPDGVFIHPNDFWTLAVSKASTSGEYFGGGPYAAVQNQLWGNLRQVVSLSAPEGFPMVGAFSQGAQVWRKGGVSVDATNSNEDDFRNDLIAIRAEQRVGLAVYYPEAFVIVDLAS